MTTQDDHDDPILETIVDGTAAERVRLERRSVFLQPTERTLAMQAGLLALLASVLPLYAFYPQSAAPYLPTMDPLAASPKVLLLGAVGGAVELVTAAVLCGVALRRARAASLSEREAQYLVDLETFVMFVGFLTGAVAILVTVGFFALGLGGEGALGQYVAAMNGANPFVSTGLPASVAGVAAAAAGASALLVGVRAVLAKRLEALRA